MLPGRWEGKSTMTNSADSKLELSKDCILHCPVKVYLRFLCSYFGNIEIQDLKCLMLGHAAKNCLEEGAVDVKSGKL